METRLFSRSEKEKPDRQPGAALIRRISRADQELQQQRERVDEAQVKRQSQQCAFLHNRNRSNLPSVASSMSGFAERATIPAHVVS